MRSMVLPSNGVPTAIEGDFRVQHSAVEIAGRLQPPPDIVVQQRLQPLLEDGRRRAVQHGDTCRVDINADDVVALLREAGACNEADVAGSDDRDLHQASEAAGFPEYQIRDRRRPSSRDTRG